MLGSHKAENVAERLKEIFTLFGFDTSKVSTLIADNASNMKKLAKSLNLNYFGCFAHLFNLIVNFILRPNLVHLGLSWSIFLNLANHRSCLFLVRHLAKSSLKIILPNLESTYKNPSSISIYPLFMLPIIHFPYLNLPFIYSLIDSLSFMISALDLLKCLKNFL